MNVITEECFGVLGIAGKDCISFVALKFSRNISVEFSI